MTAAGRSPEAATPEGEPQLTLVTAYEAVAQIARELELVTSMVDGSSPLEADERAVAVVTMKRGTERLRALAELLRRRIAEGNEAPALGADGSKP